MTFSESFPDAHGFLMEEARPLERERYRLLLGDGSTAELLAALAAFGNPDGGFGNALEPDLRVPDSSATATSVALQVLREVGAGAENTLVMGAIGYLLATLDPGTQAWASAPMAANSHPHAPWWARTETTPSEGELDNPRPEILGYFHEHAALVPPDLRASLTARVLERFDSLGEGIEMHALMCYIRLAESPGLPEPPRDALLAKLLRAVPAAVQTDPAKWGSYCLRPLDVVRSPDSPFYPDLAGAVQTQLDRELAALEAEGAARPTFSWSEVRSEAEETAMHEWTGWLTLELIRRAVAFGRIQLT